MSDYTPDRWTVIRIHANTGIVYKVFASWSGGGLMGSDSWQVNSGIVRATLADTHWEFDGSSGSVYRCHREAYGTNGYGGHVLSNLISQAQDQGIQIEVMDGQTDWAQLQYDTLAQWVQGGVKDV